MAQRILTKNARLGGQLSGSCIPDFSASLLCDPEQITELVWASYSICVNCEKVEERRGLGPGLRGEALTHTSPSDTPLFLTQPNSLPSFQSECRNLGAYERTGPLLEVSQSLSTCSACLCPELPTHAPFASLHPPPTVPPDCSLLLFPSSCQGHVDNPPGDGWGGSLTQPPAVLRGGPSEG